MEETKVCSCCGEEKPIAEFSKNGWGVMSVCRDCVKKNRKAKLDEKNKLKQQAVDAVNARKLRLEDFSPRELMARLKELGYEGVLKYTRVETIDISKI